MSNPTVIDILKEYLIAHGYDGLYDSNGECGCEVGNLVPCEMLCETCTAGYKRFDDHGDWGIYENKQKPSNVNKYDFVVGDFVDYHSMIGGPVTESCLMITSGPTELASGETVVWLKGKAGCVSIKAITHYVEPTK